MGINIDEMGMGYDAWCLASYGVDRYLNTYPVYLINYGGGQSALYAYLCSILLHFMKFSIVALRLPGVFMCFAGLVFGFLFYSLTDEDQEQNKAWYLLLAVILPIYIMPYRYGLDCNLMLPAATIFLYFLGKSLKSEKNIFYFLAGLSGGMVLYTYAIAHLVMPFFVILSFIYLAAVKKVSLKKLMVSFIPFIVLAAPLLLMHYINYFDKESFRIGFITIPKLFSYRAGEFSPGNISAELIKTCLKYTFIGDGSPSHMIVKFGTIYRISIPFLVTGFLHGTYVLFQSVRERTFKFESLLWIWMVSVIFTGCCIKYLQTYHTNGAFVSVLFFTIDGICLFTERAASLLKRKSFKYCIMAVIAGVYILNFSRFAVYYLGGEYEEDNSYLDMFYHSIEEPVSFIEDPGGDHELIDRNTYIYDIGQGYTFYQTTVSVSPYEYLSNHPLEGLDHDSRMKWESSYKNYNYVFPETITFDSNYIISKRNGEQCALLEERGFRKIEFDNYNLYYFDADDYKFLGESCVLSWDAGVDENGALSKNMTTTVINDISTNVYVGSAYCGIYQECYDDIYITIGAQNFHSDYVEREDIVEKTGNGKLINCGLLFLIPEEAMENYTQATITFINSKNKTYDQSDIFLSQ